MTSQGRPYARFRRALATGNLNLIQAAASELPAVALDDALAICIAMSGQARAERAAVRWLARFALEIPTVTPRDLRIGLAAFEALPSPAARAVLVELCEAHGVSARAL